MDRRTLLAGAGAAMATAAAPADPAWRSYVLTTRVELRSASGRTDLWLPVADARPGPWQSADRPQLTTTGEGGLVRDGRYGASMLHLRWTRDRGPRTATVVQHIRTRDRTAGDGRHLTAQERAFWTAPASSLPTDGIVKATADRVTAGYAEPRAKLHAIYEWVVDNTFRDSAVRGCGTGDIKNMIQTGRMGGKCADINSLTVGLCRAAGIPARDVYGVRLGPSSVIKVLGAPSSDVTHAQHCRAEAWLPGEGWLALDPADVRKVVLDGRLAVDSPEVKAQRQRLFGGWEMNWAAYNSATDVQLPGASRRPDENFLMYPLAMDATHELDQLEPATFSYSLSATAA